MHEHWIINMQSRQQQQQQYKKLNIKILQVKPMQTIIIIVLTIIQTTNEARLFLKSIEPTSNPSKLISEYRSEQMDEENYKSSEFPEQIVEVPEVHDHPFSCELMFFNVYGYRFFVNVTNILDNVSSIDLTIWTYKQQIKYVNTKFVNNNTATFLVDFKNISQQTQKLEMIMNFNLSYSHSGNVQVQLRKAYILFRQKVEDNYVFRLPKGTIVATTCIGLLLILTLPWNIQYRKYLPLNYNLITCLIYIILLIVAMYLQIFFGNYSTIFIIQKSIIGVFQFICTLMYSQDLLMMFIDRSRVTFVISLLFTITIMVLDNFIEKTKDAWLINDIIAIMIAGAFIKFVIIRKMKTAIWAIVLMWVFCIFREFAKQMHLQKFDQGFGIRVLPIFVQLPTYWIDDDSSLSCSAFGSSKIISFGLILNYCKRIDLYLSTQFYRILASCLAVLCVTAQLIFNILQQDLPTIQVLSVILYYPIVLALILFFANKRGQWTEIWDGSFYDMAVNRASIKREVSFSQLESQFGKEWVINSSRSSFNMPPAPLDSHIGSTVNSTHIGKIEPNKKPKKSKKKSQISTIIK